MKAKLIWKGTKPSWPQDGFGGQNQLVAHQYSRKCHQTHQKVLHIASEQWPKTLCQFSQGIYKGKDMESLSLAQINLQI